MLTWCAFMMAKFDRDSHCLEQSNCLTTEIMSYNCRCVIKVATLIYRNWCAALLWLRLEEEELNLWVGVTGVTKLCHLL